MMTLFNDFRLSSNHEDDNAEDLNVSVAKRTDIKPPSMYQVVLLNDDYTPMEFVVEILSMFFAMNREQATQVMLAVHTKGKGICGVYSKEIAETKSTQVNQFAQDNGHPLLSQIEQAD